MNEDALERLEAQLGKLLLVGVISAATLLFAGIVLWAISVDPAVANGLLNAGLLVLMATPILRVVVSVIEYAKIKDWFFVLTTLGVLTVLLVSITLAMANR